MPYRYTIHGVAQVCHEANRVLQRLQGDQFPSPPWDEAPEDQIRSAINGVQAALSGQTPEQAHQTWCDEKTRNGWVYGPVKDADAKTHPCLVPYDQLDAGQQDKDHVFAAIVQALAR
jgi:hypothetical protein